MHHHESSYQNDHRVTGPRAQRDREERTEGFDERRMILTLRIEREDEAGELIEELVDFPAVMAVCSTCEGRGRYVNPSIDAHGLSREDFEEDPDFAEDYMRGAYDIDCMACDGRRVVPEVNRGLCNPAQLETLRLVDEQERQDQQSRAEERYQRRMGY